MGIVINKKLTSYNRNKGSISRIKFIVIHYVGDTGGAEANCRYFASKYVGASAHYFVGHKGEIWQCVADKDIAWHCGSKSGYKHKTCRNSNSIGVELCCRTKGSRADNSTDWYFEDTTVKAAAELVKMLMEKYKIPSENVIRHYDVTGKMCPAPFVLNKGRHTWKEFKELISGQERTKIEGTSQATASQMRAYIKKKNPAVSKKVLEMIPYYISEGKAEGIRGDIAFAQSCLETGNFTFKGSAVTLSQNNFCGMGVTKNGMKGSSFKTAQIGIRAQIQHLKAYANKKELAQKCVDPRFHLVERGCIPYVDILGIQENPEKNGWSAGKDYGGQILRILASVLAMGEKAADTVKETAADAAAPALKPATEKFTPYTVVTTCDHLNIRKGAGTKYKIAGSINESKGHKKKYTIVKESGCWGRLKSGAGWINLKYTKKA